MKLRNGKEVDAMAMIQGMSKMPRIFRRNLWRRLRVSHGMLWHEYRLAEQGKL